MVADLVGVELAVRSEFTLRKRLAPDASYEDLLPTIFMGGSMITASIRREWAGSLFNYQAPGHKGMFYELETVGNQKYETAEYLLSHTDTGPLILLICYLQYRHVEVRFYAPKNDPVYKKEHELNWIISKALINDATKVGISEVGHIIRTTEFIPLLGRHRIVLSR
ncbi:hypothetical protein SAMN04488122_0848 [Chitinophaga arvensicola]|uniref:Uncharacterized protein n=2 Tax=Chitinophaga arvensicola TaxID=29529 RepID=A0A1I0PL60_9BACT|nr:hypothetical protein SAMN04488122_0848 [Chitinophaga arvensicola]